MYRWLIGFIIVAICIVGSLIMAAIIAISIMLEDFSNEDK